ncbi:MAG: hypothetical protein HY862_08595 [Chloroflexi bacterium]|nr:hypothetical protein [Chloroflexota bacterium]
MKQGFLGFASLLFVLVVVAVGLLGGSALATGHPQQPFLPTATFLPVEDLEYSLETVAMTADPILFDDQTVEGYTFSSVTYVTKYPHGMQFTATITPPEGHAILGVNVMYESAGGGKGRAQADLTANPNEWQGIPFDRGGLPPWQKFKVWFRVSDDAGTSIETTPVEVVYIDPTREWHRIESQDVIAYWFDFPEQLGVEVVTALAQVRDKYEKGFGGLLPFKPIVVIFPPGDSIGEFEPGGIANPRTTGQASDDTQSVVLRVRGLEIEEIRKDCIWNEPRDLQWQMRFAASVATHEVAHLYQFQFYDGRGPAWWIEGDATFFETDSGPFDQRMRHLAEMGVDLATLQDQGPSGMVGSPAQDGCTHLGYEMGTSFINWLVNTYGGYEVHRQIIELMDSNVSLPEALEQVTGITFLDLERQWRTYIGLNPEPVIIPTLEYQFPATSTPFGQ